MTTEGWSIGTAVYFCNYLATCPFFDHTVLIRYVGFVAFSTVGYGEFSFQLHPPFILKIHPGDFAPKTQAGRSIFVAWALLGVAIMTILISSMVINTILTICLFNIAYSFDRSILKVIQEYH